MTARSTGVSTVRTCTLLCVLDPTAVPVNKAFCQQLLASQPACAAFCLGAWVLGCLLAAWLAGWPAGAGGLGGLGGGWVAGWLGGWVAGGCGWLGGWVAGWPRRLSGSDELRWRTVFPRRADPWSYGNC